MTWTQWLIFFLIIQLIHGLGTWNLYKKANHKAWQAFIPVYNAVILMKIISRPWWWIILMFLPIVNLIMIPAVWVETVKSFGKETKLDALIAIVTLGFYNYYLNYVGNVTYVKNRQLKPKTPVGEWITSILFAIVAATIVHTYFFQPFVIPSSSLEKSLLVGDFLIVSKMHYGARLPMTTIAAPMVHDTIPVINKKSYLFNDNFEKRKTSWINKLQLPYFRLPGFENIERNDIVVFGQPADTLRDMNKFTPDRNYYKPIDKKTNLVKRCVAIAGDTMHIKNGDIYIDGQLSTLPERADLMHYYVWQGKESLNKRIINTYDIENSFNTYTISTTYWDDERVKQILKNAEEKQRTLYLREIKRDSAQVELYGQIVDRNIQTKLGINLIKNKYVINIAKSDSEKLKNSPSTQSIIRFVHKEPGNHIFPNDHSRDWNYDNFGPLYIPKAQSTINLTVENLPLYKRAIQEYEGHLAYAKGNQVFIDGKPATTYTFKQNYYWMMGDNRHNSIDARAWGLVPYDHVIGKPVFIWFSWDWNQGLKGIRWDRIFTTVGGTGKRTSYFIPFLVVVFGFIGYNTWRKRKKKAKA